MARKLQVRQIKSTIGAKPNQRETLRALGLRKISAVRVHDDNPVIRGMIFKVQHLIEVKEIEQ